MGKRKVKNETNNARVYETLERSREAMNKRLMAYATARTKLTKKYEK